MDLDRILRAVDSFSIPDLVKCRDSINQKIQLKQTIKRNVIWSKSPVDYVDYHPNFIDKSSVNHQAVLAELQSLAFKCSGNELCTKWLTNTGEQYSWSSNSGNVTVKNPLDIAQYPGISSIMNDILI